MKTYHSRKNTRIYSQWITACIIITVILTAMFAVIHMSNELADEPSKPVISTSLSDLQPDDTSVHTPASSTVSSTASTESTTASSTTATTTTAPTSSVSQNSTQGTVIAEYANIRSGPGAGYDLVQKVYSGEKYSVLGQADASNGITWYLIDLGGGKTGYICGAFISLPGSSSNNNNDNSIVAGGEAYLTFDDGPSKNTLRILDILDEYGVKATFFVIYNKGQEDTYRAIVERGHTLALHSYTHDYREIYSSQTAYFNDLTRLSEYVSDITGVTPLITRFPGGSSNTVSRKYCEGIMTELTKAVEARGYSYFDWNVDSGDADAATVDKDVIVGNVRSRVGSRSRVFLLMHDAKSKTTTVEALPEIIEYLQSRGYTILPITGSTAPMHHKVNN